MLLIPPCRTAPLCEQRATRLGYACRRLEPTEVPGLEAGNVDDLCLIPFELLAEPAWPALRARLWRANRTFVVAGSKLTTAQVMQAARDGAQDVLDQRDTEERWRDSLARATESQQLWLRLYGSQALQLGSGLLGDSPAMKRLRLAVDRIGPSGATVLLLGESGAGKERVAQALHEAGGGGPFVALNCAAVPKDLLESELFGAEKGAFTGALKDRPGLVEQAAGGTLFLDEVGEMDLALQPKLLRFLETRQARRVGGTREYQTQVRIVSATNRILEDEVARGAFRADLFYRLAEMTLPIPPLRERPEDIPRLVTAFLAAASERFGKHFDRIEPELIRRFQAHSWPGNARELRSAIDRLVILFDGPILRAGWWEPPRSLALPIAESRALPALPPLPPARPEPLGAALPNRRQKQELATRLLAESDNNYSWVAAQLGIDITTLFRWRKAGKVREASPPP
ncbi:MAG: sigma 54-interacting transcriptional regulator [Verrucomicrobia bacterium]|nr:sigma 54-interacting transcriptional regulator [Verrucomicrobiota bacterium]